ncbi:hypothetical protein D3C72_1658690 [compost metagenome]
MLIARASQRFQALADAVGGCIEGMGGFGQATVAGEGYGKPGQHHFIGGEERHHALVLALLDHVHLIDPGEDHFGGVVAHLQVIGDVLDDLVALVFVLQGSHGFVAAQLKGSALDRFRRLSSGDLLVCFAQLCSALFQGLASNDQYLLGLDLGSFDGHAKVHIRLQDHRLAADLVVGRLAYLQVVFANVVEATGDRSAANVHPGLLELFHAIQAPVVHPAGHGRSVFTD